MSFIHSHKTKLVTITGGEPLLQEGVIPLADRLLKEGYTVLIETNGSLPIGVLPKGVIRVMDIKCPSSGMTSFMHWKNIDARPDYANIKIEAVDIWHFIMSQGLEDYKRGDLGSIETLAKNINDLANYSDFSGELKEHFKDYYEQIAVVEVLMKTLFCEGTTEKLMAAFIDVAMQSGLNLDTLYTLYVGKNILNQFRQDHGYKEGTYIKIWNGEEDNVTMQKVLEENENVTPNELYTALEAAYPKE
jgi:dimeric dUTPase (all-alpha-NTP-PPase superfamily)